MLSLFGSLLGFGTSFLPKIMDFFQDRQDKAHELAVMTRQMELQLKLQEAGAVQKLEAINVDADIRETEALHKEQTRITLKASQGFINLSASVRPVISYLFFFEFLLLSVAVFMDWMTEPQYTMIWNNEMQAIFAAVVSFWFGQRTFGRK
ncbi:MAG: hypothetical protein ISR50_16580 [Alphaproteobacteria bacterium]|nr:hypothetical protein [Alphaproteobacteria bacterium]MBL6954257.1 hypothetical protein [Alphaproteobacteria bacterium]